MNERRRQPRRISDRVSATYSLAPPPPTPVSRRTYIYANAFEAFIAFASVLAAITFFASPGTLSDSAIGHALHPYDLVWNVLYLFGGLFVIVGLSMNRGCVEVLGREYVGYTFELAGLIFLGTAVMVACVAALTEVGFTSGTALYGAVVAATVARGVAIASTRKMTVPVEVPARGN